MRSAAAVRRIIERARARFYDYAPKCRGLLIAASPHPAIQLLIACERIIGMKGMVGRNDCFGYTAEDLLELIAAAETVISTEVRRYDRLDRHFKNKSDA